MKPADRYWLAGLLEGEGSFTYHRQTRGRYVPKVIVRMTDLDVVERAAALMGSRIHTQKRLGGHKDLHGTAVTGKRAVRLMRSLLPLMGERRSTQIRRFL